MRRRLPIVLLLVLAAGLAAGRLSIAVDAYEDRDGLYFARGVERYALLETRPFWPGYPVLIWLGRLVRLLTGDVSRALHGLSAVSSGLTVLPLAAIAAVLARDMGRPAAAAAALAAVLWSASPLAWATGSQALSEPAALLLALSAFAVGQRARGPRGWIAMGVLAGLAVGCRPPFAVLLPGIALAHPSWQRGEPRRRRAAILSLAAFAATCAAWLGWQIWQEGWESYALAAQIILSFSRHGGGNVLADPGMGQRIERFAVTTFAHGFGVWRPGRGLLSVLGAVVLAGALPLALARVVRAGRRTWAALAWLAVYGAVILVANHPGYVRYCLPLVAMLCAVLPVALPARLRPAAVACVAASVLAVALGGPAIVAHARRPVMGLEVVEIVRAVPGAVLLSRGGEPYLPFYLDEAGVRWERVTSDDLWSRAQAQAEAGATVLSTLPSPEKPERWMVHARVKRGERIEMHGPREIVLFRLSAAASRPRAGDGPPTGR